MIRFFLRSIMVGWGVIASVILLTMWMSAFFSTGTISFWGLRVRTAERHLLDTQTGVMTQLEGRHPDGIISPDGQWLLISEALREARLRISLANADGTAEHIVDTFNMDTPADFVQWSADSRHAYIIDGEIDGTTIYTLDVQTGTLEIYGEYPVYAWKIGLSPNREYILLRDAVFTASNGYIIHMPTGRSARLATGDEFTWSPNNRYIAYIVMLFERRNRPQMSLQVIDLLDFSVQDYDATDLGGAINEYLPIWSPDGQQLAISTYNQQLIRFDISTETSTVILDRSVQARHWSPDGQHILIQEEPVEDHYVVSIVDVDTGLEHELFTTNQAGIPEQVAWSTDQRYLAVDYYPQGFTGDRVLAVFDAMAGFQRFSQALELRTYYPIMPRSGTTVVLGWWQNS